MVVIHIILRQQPQKTCMDFICIFYCFAYFVVDLQNHTNIVIITNRGLFYKFTMFMFRLRKNVCSLCIENQSLFSLSQKLPLLLKQHFNYKPQPSRKNCRVMLFPRARTLYRVLCFFLLFLSNTNPIQTLNA